MGIFQNIKQKLTRSQTGSETAAVVVLENEKGLTARREPEVGIEKRYDPRQFSTQNKTSFDATSSERLYPGLGAKTHIDLELAQHLPLLRGIGRDQEQNNPYGKRYLQQVTVNVLGRDGIKLKCQFTDKKRQLIDELNEDIEDAWSRWGRMGVCEVTGKFSWVRCQELVLLALKRDGEIFVRMLGGWSKNDFGFAIQLIMADRIDHRLNAKGSDGRYISLGIEYDAFGAPVAYYFLDDNGIEIFPGGKRHQRVNASEIRHIYKAKRPDQSRGYTEFSASVNKLRMLHGADEAELVHRRFDAAVPGFLEEQAQDRAGLLNDDDDSADSSGDFYMSGEAGSIPELPRGKTFKPKDGKHDGDPADFRKGQLRAAAAGLSVNYSDFSMDYEGVNYTTIRAAYLTDRDGYAVEQRDLEEQLCQPIFAEWLKFAVLKKAVTQIKTAADVPKYTYPSWIGRGWKWVDPLKEAKGYELMLERGLISEEEIIAERGGDLEETYLKQLSAKRLREKLGVKEKGEES